MKGSLALAFGIALALAGHPPANAAEGVAKPVHHHHRNIHHRGPPTRTPVAAETVEPVQVRSAPAATPLIRNNSDGLSRDPEECNFGCLDNTQ